MGRPMNLSIDSKIGTSKNNPQQLIATVIVKVLGSKRLLLFTFFLFFSVPPSNPPPPPPSSTKGEILQNGSRVNEMSFKVGGGELEGRISTTVCKGEYLRGGKLETEEKYIK